MDVRESLASAVSRAFAEPYYRTVLATQDPLRRVRRFTLDDARLVAKRCTMVAGRQEHRRAVAARERWPMVTFPLPVALVVPEVVDIGNGECALVSQDLGQSLETSADRTRRLIQPAVLAKILSALLYAGLEAPGFVPRNLFWLDQTLWVIDFEDARIGPQPVIPDELTVVKWDIAWSDIYRQDPGLREQFTTVTRSRPADRFERTLSMLLEHSIAPEDVCRIGIAMTLQSELYGPGTKAISAAELGHLADELLAPQHSVFHTALTAYLRDHGYPSIVDELWRTVRGPIKANAPHAHTSREAITAAWLETLCGAADDAIGNAPSLNALKRGLTRLAGATGWQAGIARGAIAELIVARIGDLVRRAFGVRELDLLLRGSLAQGVLGSRSDIDFELSSHRHAHGHAELEQLIIDVLAAYGLKAEGSASRPVEGDICTPGSEVTREAHEWLELRRPGSTGHDPGWAGGILRPTRAVLFERSSEYERAGRQVTAKYMWFEARAALARTVCRACRGTLPVTIAEQLAILPQLIDAPIAAELSSLLVDSFALREQDDHDRAACLTLARRLDMIRTTLDLPGPVSDIHTVGTDDFLGAAPDPTAVPSGQVRPLRR